MTNQHTAADYYGVIASRVEHASVFYSMRFGERKALRLHSDC